MKSLSLLACALLLTGCSTAPRNFQPAPVRDISIPACVEEDGSGQALPCLWEGGDTGLSYILNPDHTVAMLSTIPVPLFETMTR